VFLKWIPQLLSVLTSSSSKQCVDAAGSCIERLVQDYPRAIFFPFQLSVGNSANLSAVAKLWIANLTKLLDSSCAYLHAFVRQLDQIGFAQLRVRDLWNSCKNIIASKLLPEKEKSVAVADLIEEFETKVCFMIFSFFFECRCLYLTNVCVFSFSTTPSPLPKSVVSTSTLSERTYPVSLRSASVEPKFAAVPST
jgi:hypothetical protein